MAQKGYCHIGIPHAYTDLAHGSWRCLSLGGSKGLLSYDMDAPLAHLDLAHGSCRCLWMTHKGSCHIYVPPAYTDLAPSWGCLWMAPMGYCHRDAPLAHCDIPYGFESFEYHYYMVPADVLDVPKGILSYGCPSCLHRSRSGFMEMSLDDPHGVTAI